MSPIHSMHKVSAKKNLFNTSTPLNSNKTSVPIACDNSDHEPLICHADVINDNFSPEIPASQDRKRKRILSPVQSTTKKYKYNDKLPEIVDANVGKKDRGKSSKKKKSAKSKKKNKKLKKTKKRKYSEDDYDSDQYVRQTKLENMKSWHEELKDGTKVKMMHLCFGVSITYDAWKEIRDITSASLYLRKLARAIWGAEKLINRTLDVRKTHRSIPNRSPRKCLTPVKKAALRKTFFTFVSKNIVPKNRKSTKRQWKRYLSDYINYLIKTELKSHKQENSSSSDGSNSTDSSSESSATSSNDDWN